MHDVWSMKFDDMWAAEMKKNERWTHELNWNLMSGFLLSGLYEYEWEWKPLGGNIESFWCKNNKSFRVALLIIPIHISFHPSQLHQLHERYSSFIHFFLCLQLMFNSHQTLIYSSTKGVGMNERWVSVELDEIDNKRFIG